mmetsp:Transcript_14682/g.44108  ORF Transcript_14682/g.44108 Transcript_14682/m.44108 type:complete len:226 (-) Transcript_14682:2423-3100(-)
MSPKASGLYLVLLDHCSGLGRRALVQAIERRGLFGLPGAALVAGWGAASLPAVVQIDAAPGGRNAGKEQADRKANALLDAVAGVEEEDELLAALGLTVAEVVVVRLFDSEGVAIDDEGRTVRWDAGLCAVVVRLALSGLLAGPEERVLAQRDGRHIGETGERRAAIVAAGKRLVGRVRRRVRDLQRASLVAVAEVVVPRGEEGKGGAAVGHLDEAAVEEGSGFHV